MPAAAEMGKVTIITGDQRGDEGKGRAVDMLMAEFDIGARANGACNAGHTIARNDSSGNEQVYKLHGLPTSVLHEHATSVIGNGAAVDPVKLSKEIDDLAERGIAIDPKNLLIGSGTHLILPNYISEDKVREAGPDRQGSTKSGIAQVYGQKGYRTGLRSEDIVNNLHVIEDRIILGLLQQQTARKAAGMEEMTNCDEQVKVYLEACLRLGKYVSDVTLYLNQELRKPNPANILVEGAQAALLDIDHGMYPFVTSSSTMASGLLSGLGIAPKFIGKTIGVVKARPSHVGDGPFVTEEHDPEKLLQLHGDKTAVDAEVGTTTGRERRLGYLDLPQVKRAQMINGTDEIVLTKLDRIPDEGDMAKVCVAYDLGGKQHNIGVDTVEKMKASKPVFTEIPTWSEDISTIRDFNDLPTAAQDFVHLIEDETKLPVTYIGVGPNRDQVIIRD